MKGATLQNNRESTLPLCILKTLNVCCEFTEKGLTHPVKHSYFWGVGPGGEGFSLFI